MKFFKFVSSLFDNEKKNFILEQSKINTKNDFSFSEINQFNGLPVENGFDAAGNAVDCTGLPMSDDWQ